MRLIVVPVPILLSAAVSQRPGLLLRTPEQHLPSEEDSCRKPLVRTKPAVVDF